MAETTYFPRRLILAGALISGMLLALCYLSACRGCRRVSAWSTLSLACGFSLLFVGLVLVHLPRQGGAVPVAGRPLAPRRGAPVARALVVLSGGASAPPPLLA